MPLFRHMFRHNKAAAQKTSCLSYRFFVVQFLLCGFCCPVGFLCGFTRKTSVFSGHAQYAGRRIAQTRRMLHVKPVVCCTLNCAETHLFLQMQALLTDKTDRSCFKRSFPLTDIRFAAVGDVLSGS